MVTPKVLPLIKPPGSLEVVTEGDLILYTHEVINQYNQLRAIHLGLIQWVTSINNIEKHSHE